MNTLFSLDVICQVARRTIHERRTINDTSLDIKRVQEMNDHPSDIKRDRVKRLVRFA